MQSTGSHLTVIVNTVISSIIIFSGAADGAVNWKGHELTVHLNYI